MKVELSGNGSFHFGQSHGEELWGWVVNNGQEECWPISTMVSCGVISKEKAEEIEAEAKK